MAPAGYNLYRLLVASVPYVTSLMGSIGQAADVATGGRYVEDLTTIYEIGEKLGARLCAIGMEELGAPMENYGKACIIGMDGKPEHGGVNMGDYLARIAREEAEKT